LVFWSFRLMVGLGFLFPLVAIIAWWKRNSLESSPLLLRTCLYMVPLPFLAAQLGWLVKEVGRQPWLVYGVMRTTDGHSTAIVGSQVAVSLLGFIVLYSILGLVAYALIIKLIKKGPAAA
jgi:cytochrome bd ubiquinol oxidase subunit I